ncbi:Putative ubiquitin thioesterase L96, partial [Frankliniella fusca]
GGALFLSPSSPPPWARFPAGWSGAGSGPGWAGLPPAGRARAAPVLCSGQSGAERRGAQRTPQSPRRAPPPRSPVCSWSLPALPRYRPARALRHPALTSAPADPGCARLPTCPARCSWCWRCSSARSPPRGPRPCRSPPARARPGRARRCTGRPRRTASPAARPGTRSSSPASRCASASSWTWTRPPPPTSPRPPSCRPSRRPHRRPRGGGSFSSGRRSAPVSPPRSLTSSSTRFGARRLRNRRDFGAGASPQRMQICSCKTAPWPPSPPGPAPGAARPPG